MTPDPPEKFNQPSVFNNYLIDELANKTLKPPSSWPGLSFPSLFLYKDHSSTTPSVHSAGVPPTNSTESNMQGEVETKPKLVTKETVGDREAFSCGGALISPYHVMTAAHCLLEPGLTENGTVNFLKPTVVRLGEVDFNRTDEGLAYDYEVDGVQVHEGYALPAKYNDIAIITLKHPVKLTEALQPYCLPQRNLDLVGVRLTVSGWGKQPGGTASTILHNVGVVVISQEECTEDYAAEDIRPFFDIQYPHGVNNLLLCAKGEQAVCRGDSGGPLVLDENGIKHDVGIVSSGYGCGTSQYPGIYTSVSEFIGWIKDEIYGSCSSLI